MATDHLLKCQCGQPIAAADVERIMLLLIGDTPAWYYCKYRCHHCDHVGQELIRPDEWAPGELFIGGEQLPDPPPLANRPSRSEEKPAARRSARRRRRSSSRKTKPDPISTDEVIDFALALEAVTREDLEMAFATPEEER